MACGFCAVTPVSPCPVCEVAPVAQVIRKAKPARKAQVARPVTSRSATILATPVVAVVAPRAVQSPRLVVIPQDAPSALLSKVETTYQGRTTSTDAADACAEQYAAGQMGMAIALLVGLADADKREQRLQVLLYIDANAAKRGYLSDADNRLRNSIETAAFIEAKRNLGFDPRVARPQVAPAPKPSTTTVDTVPARPSRMPDAAPPTIRDMPAVVIPAPVKALPIARGPLKQGDWAGLDEMVKRGELTHAEAVAFGTLWTNSAHAKA
jgi:hypothetical protein